MTEQILVNISKARAVVSLPTGRPYIIEPGFAVQGDHFAKFVSSGVLVPLAHIPAGFTVRGISHPLGGEGVRQDSQAPSYAKNANKSAKPVAAPKQITAAENLANQGKTTSEEVSETLLAGVPGHDPDGKPTCQGLTNEQWKTRLQGISDATFLQQMKLGQLRELAVFFGIESASVIQTKPDFVRAIRLRIR